MKIRFFVLLAAVLLGGASAFAQNGYNEPLKGDVNEDGTVDVADITAIIKIIKDGSGTPEPVNPYVDLNFEAYWSYESDLSYDWQAEWIYGWDEIDKMNFGEIGYTAPSVFNVRSYKTDVPGGPHINVISNTVSGTSLFAPWNFGYWDILAWSAGETNDIPSLNIDETLDGVTAYTPQTFHYAPWASGSTRSYWQPGQLFSGYTQAIEIDENLNGFVYDEERGVWVRSLYMMLKPITYTYLTQIILHNNHNKITGVDGSADLSGMARSTNLFTEVAGSDPVNVTYDVRFKPSVTMPQTGETVDVIGGRLMTFGIPNQNGNRISRPEDVEDNQEHYLGINVLFNNGMDSPLVFNVTDQIRRRWRGGVITVELDMDTIPVPNRQ